MKALILVDIQNDFLPGGNLAVPAGDQIISPVNEILSAFPIVIATKDWHPQTHQSFASVHPGKQIGELIDLHGLPQILWPDHCVQDSYGSQFPANLRTERIQHVVYKGVDPEVDSYSGFFDNGRKRATDLAAYLSARGATELYIVGLATDYCVKATTLDALSLGFPVFVVEDCCRGVNLQPMDVERSFEEMRRAGAKQISSTEVLAQVNPVATHYSGRFLSMKTRGGWEFAERIVGKEVVVITAVRDKKVLLVEQFRPPVNAWVLELPAGLVGDIPGEEMESYERAASRELLEETGFQAEKWEHLVSGPCTAGLSNEILHFYLASGLTRVSSGGGDNSEHIILHEIPLQEVRTWLEERKRQSGILIDPKIYTGLYFAN